MRDRIRFLEQELLVSRTTHTNAPAPAPAPTTLILPPSNFGAPPPPSAPAAPAPAPKMNETIHCNFNESEKIILLNKQIAHLESEL